MTRLEAVLPWIALIMYMATVMSCSAALSEPLFGHSATQGSSGRLLSEAMPEGQPCPALTKDVLTKHAKDNTVIVMCIDHVLFKRFAHSWVSSVREANITYWYVAAMDLWASKALGALGVTQCFNAPVDPVVSSERQYQWGSGRWHQMTWKKVHVMNAVYELGFNIIHSDADTTWWDDPLPWFQEQMPKWNLHMVFSTDSLNTQNINGDMGPEMSTTPFFNINTGVYYVVQYEGGREFFRRWLAMETQRLGHDQDGLNKMVRGRYWRDDEAEPYAKWFQAERVVIAALHNVTRVSLLPIHLFGNAYTYSIGRVHERLQSKLYVTHWVWTGGSPESKIQHVRDAMKYVDAPSWYGLPSAGDDELYEFTEHPPPEASRPLMLLSMSLEPDAAMPEGFNSWRLERTEEMIRFHLEAAQRQLKQAYWGLLAAAALGRTFILPAFRCYCTKNWYMTQACRINGERHTTFPINCPLSDLFRAKKMLAGLELPTSPTGKTIVHVRERSFLQHPRVPKEIKDSRLVIRAAGPPITAPPGLDALTRLQRFPATEHGGSVAVVDAPWPLTTEELSQVVNNVPGAPFRVVHLEHPERTLGRGFNDNRTWDAFDLAIQRYRTYWCCRSPQDMENLKRPDKELYEIVPEWRKVGREPWVSSIAAAG